LAKQAATRDPRKAVNLSPRDAPAMSVRVSFRRVTGLWSQRLEPFLPRGVALWAGVFQQAPRAAGN